MRKEANIPIAPSIYSLCNKMDNSLLAVRDINHKYIVVERRFYEKKQIFISYGSCACSSTAYKRIDSYGAGINPHGAVETDDFIRGVDVSTLDMLEDLGAQYYQNNVANDALTILHNNGANYVRLKLWVDPYDEDGNAYGGGNNDYDTTLALAKRAQNL